MAANIHIYQIYYDAASQGLLDPGFIPLDNTRNERPDWFEFWVIRQYLKNHTLEDNAWYGFLSPKFAAKTGLDAQGVLGLVQHVDAYADTVLLSPAWDLLAYFLNPFEQGENVHPGLAVLAQEFFDTVGIKADVQTLVTHATTSVFSNFIVAKPKFWRQWLAMADRFFEFVEYGNSSDAFRAPTRYKDDSEGPAMKAFIQERLASVVLSQGEFMVVAPDLSRILAGPFVDDIRTRVMLQTCNLMKEYYCFTREEEYLAMYGKIRRDIAVQEEAAPQVWVGRNEPCPCGSGMKFKHCHGALA